MTLLIYKNILQDLDYVGDKYIIITVIIYNGLNRVSLRIFTQMQLYEIDQHFFFILVCCSSFQSFTFIEKL